jgi:hypothetical protein
MVKKLVINKENTIGEISKFHKTNFNVDNIVSNASSLKYIKEIKKQINAELESPSNDFTKLFANKVYTGRLTEKVVDEFKDLVQKSVSQYSIAFSGAGLRFNFMWLGRLIFTKRNFQFSNNYQDKRYFFFCPFLFLKPHTTLIINIIFK